MSFFNERRDRLRIMGDILNAIKKRAPADVLDIEGEAHINWSHAGPKVKELIKCGLVFRDENKKFIVTPLGETFLEKYNDLMDFVSKLIPDSVSKKEGSIANDSS